MIRLRLQIFYPLVICLHTDRETTRGIRKDLPVGIHSLARLQQELGIRNHRLQLGQDILNRQLLSGIPNRRQQVAIHNHSKQDTPTLLVGIHSSHKQDTPSQLVGIHSSHKQDIPNKRPNLLEAIHSRNKQDTPTLLVGIHRRLPDMRNQPSNQLVVSQGCLRVHHRG